MLTDFKLSLEVNNSSDNVQILLSDRYNQLTVARLDNQTSVDISFKFSIPNRLCIEIDNLEPSNFIRLKGCCLGGLLLPQHILDQICQYTPASSNDMLITTVWDQCGKIYIDFFAGDWVQYHLLYGNKIII